MKRGLVVLDPAEVPPDEWASRVATLQDSLRSSGVDVALIYNDVSRGDDIGYLTNLVIYWNEGVLAVPAEGNPALLTKLSKRVHTWMRRTSTLDDLRSGRTFADLVAAYLADRPAGAIGFVDADLWPATVMDEIAAAAPDWRVVALGPLVRDRRAIPSPAELALLCTGAAVLRDALTDATAPGLTMRERLAVVDRVVRHGGYADALVRGRDHAGHVTIEVSGEYRHGWLAAGRTFGDEPWLGALAQAQRAAFAAVRAGAAWGSVERAALAALDPVPAEAVRSVRWISQADIATGGELRAPSPAPADGEVIAIVIEVITPDGVRSVLTDTVHVTPSGARPLTAATPAPTPHHGD